MRKIWTIAAKELYTTFTDRTLLMIMIATPLLVSTIIALAFGGGEDPDSLSIGEIPIAIVNLDEGLNLTGAPGLESADTAELADSLFSLGIDQTTEDGSLTPFNAGTTLASILAPGSDSAGSRLGGALPACSLVTDAGAGDGFDMTLEELFAPTLMTDPAAARQAVESGEVVAAVIVPAGFTQLVLPIAQLGQQDADPASPVAAIEIYANAGNPIEANVTRAVVEGIVGQFSRMGLAVFGLADTVGQTLAAGDSDLADVDLAALPELTAPLDEWQLFLNSLADQSPWFAALAGAIDQFAGEGNADNALGNELGAAIACLFDPAAGAIAIVQEPLNALQEQSRFEQVMVQVGSAQAVFFALFTGVFGILAIYQERKQWTLQRMLASPTSRTSVLGGFLAGNVVVVWMQLVLLMFFLTIVTSLIIRQPSFIWGTQWLLLFLLTVTISLCVSGLGVLVVGVARTPEQVQVFAPVLNIFLGALGGAFGFFVPPALAKLSLITWATEAYRHLAAGQTDIWLNLAVLTAQGALFFGLGLWFFKRRVDL